MYMCVSVRMSECVCVMVLVCVSMCACVCVCVQCLTCWTPYVAAAVSCTGSIGCAPKDQ